MNTVSPIRDKREIELVKQYLKSKNLRDYLLYVIGINCNLRVSDLLRLRVQDVWDGKRCLEHVTLNERKTGKFKKFAINANIQKAVKEYIKEYQ